MAKLKINITRADIGRLFNLEAVEDAIKEELRRQRVERFRTEGASDGSGMKWAAHRHDPSRSVLTDTGKLRDFTDFQTTRRRGGITVEMRIQSGLELVSNVHQFGVNKPIVPKSAKALFIPLTGRGRKSFFTGSIGESAPGSDFIPLGTGELTGRKRFGTKGNRRGLNPEVVNLKQSRLIKQGKRAGQRTRGDFLLVASIPVTAEKEGYAIQPRPHFRVSEQNAADLKGVIQDSLIGR